MKRYAVWMMVGLFMVVGLVAGAKPAAAADVVVGTGTPASCDEAALDAAIATVQAAGSGTITFACGPSLHTIEVFSSAEITKEVRIDGDKKIRLFAQGSAPNFVRPRFFEVKDGGTLELYDLTLEGARGPAGDGWGSQGGSIVVWGASVLDLQNVTILNSASTAWGGAIANEGGAVRVQNSLISGTAKWGGAYNGANGYDIFINTSVINSAAGEGGGGLRLWNTLHSEITDSTIADNSAGAGGGGVENLGGKLVISGSYIERNVAHTGGGLMNANNGDRTATAEIKNSLIAGNASVANGGGAYSTGILGLFKTTLSDNGAEWGGGMVSYGGLLVLTDATVNRNKATAGGGGLYIERGGASLDDTIITENEAQEGGGLFAAEVEGANAENWVRLDGVDVIDNQAFTGAGGGILARRAYMTVERSEIAGNSGVGLYLVDSPSGGSYVTLNGSSVHDNGAGLFNGEASTLLVYNTTVSRNNDWGVWAGLDSIFTDLRFSTVRGNDDGQIKRTGGRLALEATAIDRGTSANPNCATDAGLPALEGGGSVANDNSCGPSVTVSSGLNLGPLALNGGQTPNHLPGDGSVLIDAVACGSNAIDQRGAPRPQGSQCDIGAVEVGSVGFQAQIPLVIR